MPLFNCSGRIMLLIGPCFADLKISSTAYAIYFDYRRQSDPEFRRALKRDNRRLARTVRQESEAHGAQQMESIRQAVADAKDEGFPADLEEREGFFMSQVAKGEALCADSTL